MKFDVVEPSDEQAIVDGEENGENEDVRVRGEDHPGDVHPKLALASQQMHVRLRDDLTTLHSALDLLHEHVQIAQRREADEAPDAVGTAPPVSFRANAFSRARTRTNS